MYGGVGVKVERSLEEVSKVVGTKKENLQANGG
jgi:hypothetical protein